ncbi:MAG: MFS transporter [Holosporales bacterium]|jgi:MFS family permease|nr:MFS transporter [Holosporales bacterium]
MLNNNLKNPSIFGAYNQQPTLRDVVLLILMVFFSTMASLIISSILPIYLIDELHFSAEQVGFVEGWAVWAAFMSKNITGMLSDKYQRRKVFIVSGTFLSIVSKGIFALTTGFVSVFAVKILDRIAKGLRSCLVDATIADAFPVSDKWCYFFYYIKYLFFMGGAICGGIVARSLLFGTGNRCKLVFLFALIPALIAYVCSTKISSDCCKSSKPNHADDGAVEKCISDVSTTTASKSFIGSAFSAALLKFYGIIFVLMFAKFSDSFLVMKARSLDLQVHEAPLFAIIFSISSFCGTLFSSVCVLKINRTRLLYSALFIQFFAHATAFFATSRETLMLSNVLFGLHLGIEQGALLAIISGLSNQQTRATTFSIYYAVTALGLLLSNLTAGKLNFLFESPSAAFLSGAIFCCFSLFLLRYFMRHNG